MFFFFFPLLAPLLSLDRGLWVKRRGECSITTRSDPIKYRFNQSGGRPVNTQSDQAAAATGVPGSVGATLHIYQAEGIDSWVRVGGGVALILSDLSIELFHSSAERLGLHF